MATGGTIGTIDWGAGGSGLNRSPTPTVRSVSGGSGGDSQAITGQELMEGPAGAVLSALIQQLFQGGTPEQQASRQQRAGEASTIQGERAGFSKEAALSDAQGLIQATLSETLQKLLPTITRAAEGAGTSAGSMRALLAQDAARQASEAAAKAGIGAVGTYGTQFANLSQILESLTRPQDANTQQLIQALQIARGVQGQGGVGNQSTTGIDLPRVQLTPSSGEPFQGMTRTPTAPSASAPAPSTAPTSFGPQTDLTTQALATGLRGDDLANLLFSRGFTF